MTTDDEDKAKIEQAEAKIREGEAAIARGEHELEEGERELDQALHHTHPDRYSYTVDGKEYFTESKSLTGLQIKSKVPNVNPAYQLVEESSSSSVADRVIGDNETVEIAVKPAPVFYLVPPATFG